MDPALVRLQLLLMKATIRQILRGAGTVRGAFLLIFTIALISMGIVPSIVVTLTTRGQPEALSFASAIEPILPGILLLMCLALILTSAGEFSILFTPAEIDFLFPAPFHRRQLLVYKLSKMARGLALMALLFSIYFLPGLRSWISGFVGFFLTFLFMNLAGMVLTLAGQIVSVHSYYRTRRTVMAVIGILAAVATAQTMARVTDRNPLELARAFRGSVAGRILLAPFEVFSRTICADGISEGLIGWGSAAAAIDLVLLALVFRLDANYLESASTISGKVYERVLRARLGGGIAIPVSSKSTWLRPRRFPWLLGVGPVAWRQVVMAIRRSRLQLIVSIILAASFLIVMKFQSRVTGGPADGVVGAVSLIGGLVYLTFLLSMQAPWAFRGDLDHIEGLKTLPVRPIALVLGELSGGVLILTAIQATILAIVPFVIPARWSFIFIAFAFTMPLNTLLLGASNLLFLIYPVRMASGGTADIRQVGRGMVFMILQGLILIPTLGIPAGIGGIAYLAGGPPWACGTVAWASLLAEIPPILWLIGWAFQQFDPGTQTPA